MLWSEGKPEAALADRRSAQAIAQLAQALHAKGVLLRHYKKTSLAPSPANVKPLSLNRRSSVHAELLALYYGQGDKAALRAQLDQMRKLMPRSPVRCCFVRRPVSGRGICAWRVI